MLGSLPTGRQTPNTSGAGSIPELSQRETTDVEKGAASPDK